MKTAQVSQILLSAESVCDFLAKYIETRKSARRGYGYSDLAKASQITSRSFMRDLVLGRRAMTLETLKKLSAGLKFTNDQSKYLEAMMSIEKARKAKDPKLFNEASLRVESLKKKISSSAKKVATPETRHKTFGTETWPYVYSSLIDEKTGATLEAIAHKSRVEIPACHEILNQLCEIKVVETRLENDQTLYFPTSTILSFDKMGDADFFQTSFIKNAQQMTKSAEKTFSDSKNRLFLDAIFSVESKKLPAFREALQKRILETVQEFENPHGDDIATFVCGFFRRSDLDV
jgi:hypothetical protein